MARYVDIDALADEVLAHVAEPERQKTAAELAPAVRTSIGTELKTAANSVRSYQDQAVTYQDLQLVKTARRCSHAKSIPRVQSTSALGSELRKLSHSVRSQGRAAEGARLTKAAQMLTAAAGLQHLLESLK